MLLVALTGWGQDEDRQKSQDAGFNAHLLKPVDYATLTKLLGEKQAVWPGKLAGVVAARYNRPVAEAGKTTNQVRKPYGSLGA